MQAHDPSARRAQRADQTRLARHIINELHHRAKAERTRQIDAGNPGEVIHLEVVMMYLDSITDPKLAVMLDNFTPLLDAAGVEDELKPIIPRINASRLRGGVGPVALGALQDRIVRALSLLTKEAD